MKTSDRYRFSIHTYGCKVNTYDTGLLQKRLEQAGLEQDSSSPSVHILNTCAVTAEATREAVKQVRRLKAKDPLSTVVVTGCGAQVDGAAFDELPGVDLVVANSHKGQLENLLDRFFAGTLDQKVFRSNIFRKDDLEAGGGVEAAHTRTFLKIQDGCNSFCTYCVIPYARGKSRSIPVSDLVRRVRELHAAGIHEVVLTGVHIGDYEDDSRAGLSGRLEGLVAEVLEKTEVPRLRLTSLEPVELSPELLALYRKTDRLCPHFHMSIQSANTRVLQAMRRGYTAEDVERALEAIQANVPGAYVGMDVIVGFPGETEEEFADTYQRLDRLPWTRMHVFPYSERPGTRAALLPDSVPKHLRAARSQRLRELSLQRLERAAQAQIGTRKKVMILNKPAHGAQGLSRDYWPVRFEGVDVSDHAGREVEAQILGYAETDMRRSDGCLVGQVVL